jgi:hypothetical protein
MIPQIEHKLEHLFGPLHVQLAASAVSASPLPPVLKKLLSAGGYSFRPFAFIMKSAGWGVKSERGGMGESDAVDRQAQ